MISVKILTFIFQNGFPRMPSNPIPSLPSSTPSWGGSGMASSPYSTAAAAGGGGATQRESSFHRKRPTLGISEGKHQLKNTCFLKIKNTKITFVVSNWLFWKYTRLKVKKNFGRFCTVKLHNTGLFFKSQNNSLFSFFWCGTSALFGTYAAVGTTWWL